MLFLRSHSLVVLVLACVAPTQVHAQKYWKPNPVNRDFDDNRNWQLSFPIVSSLHVVQGPHSSGDGPVLQQPTTIDNLWLTNSARLTNATTNSAHTYIVDSHDLDVQNRILVDGGAILKLSSTEHEIRTLRCQELELDTGSLILQSADIEAKRISIRRSPMIAGAAEIRVPSGGVFLLEDSLLNLTRLSGEPSDEPEFRIVAEDTTALVDLDGDPGSRTRISIDDRYALRVEADLSNDPFDGEIQFKYSGGEIDIRSGLKLANSLENKVYINDSSATILNGFDLNGGTLIVAGYLFAENFRAGRGAVRSCGTMEFDNAYICLPDVHQGGPCTFEHSSSTRIIGSGCLYFVSQGSRIDWDGMDDGARFLCTNNTHLLVVADSLDKDSFGGELKLQSGVVAEFEIAHDWLLAGSLLLEKGGQAVRTPIHVGSAGRIFTSGLMQFVDPVESVFYSPVTFVAGAETKLAETNSVGDASQITFRKQAVFETGSLLQVPTGATVRFEDVAILNRGVTVQGKGELSVADSGSLALKLARVETGLVNDGSLDLGWRSQPIELSRFEQTTNGQLFVEARFLSGPQLTPKVAFPTTEEIMLGGSLHVQFAQSAAKAGDRMTLFAAKSIRGGFSNVSADSLPSGLALVVEVRKHSVDLVVEKVGTAH